MATASAVVAGTGAHNAPAAPAAMAVATRTMGPMRARCARRAHIARRVEWARTHKRWQKLRHRPPGRVAVSATSTSPTTQRPHTSYTGKWILLPGSFLRCLMSLIRGSVASLIRLLSLSAAAPAFAQDSGPGVGVLGMVTRNSVRTDGVSEFFDLE